MFFVFSFLTLYPYFIYPLILFFLSIFFKKKERKSYSFEPEITILIPLHNEEDNIPPLIKSIFDSNYPKEKINILFGSDGSTDNTNAVLEKSREKYPNIEYLILPRMGKSEVINHLLPLIETEIVIFVDADVRLAKQTLKEMVSYFRDPEIGGVISNLIVTKDKKDDINPEERHTQRFFNLIRKLESKIFGTFNNNGPCYAVRRELLQKIPNKKVCDDFFNVLNIFQQRKRIIFAKNALAYDSRPRNNILSEYQRKKRFSAGGLSAIFAVRKIFLHPLFAFFLFSHKVMRWLSPVFAILALILLFINSDNFIKIFIFWSAILFLLFGLVGLIKEMKGKRASKIFRIPLFILLSVAGTISGFIRAFLGKQNSSWTLNGLEEQNEATN